MKTVGYTYDKNGRRTNAANEDSSITWQYNQIDRVVQQTQVVKGMESEVADATYVTGYVYDKIGNVTEIIYPNSSQSVTYHYNRLNQLVGVDNYAPGTVVDPAFTYEASGFLKKVEYDNHTEILLTPDTGNRIGNIQVTRLGETTTQLMDLTYEYDGNSNVTKITDELTGFINEYAYDDLDRLTQANIEGIFYGERSGINGVAEQDVFGTLIPVEAEDYYVKLDYQANSIGVLLAEKAMVGKIELKPGTGVTDHRLTKNSLGVYYSLDNLTFQPVPAELWEFEKDEDGDITIRFCAPIEAMAYKVHSRFDDRGKHFDHVDKSTFTGNLTHMIRVFERAESGQLEYDYDLGGNRTEKRKVVRGTEAVTYDYYENTNQLKKSTNNQTGEVTFYQYDANGNLTTKTVQVGETADGSIATGDDPLIEEIWEYDYTPDNRLKKVSKNGVVKGKFRYDPLGNRIQSWSEEEGTINYVFGLEGKVIYEENLTKGSSASFIYALGKQIVKVEGDVGSDAETLYYYHDNLGSSRMMADQAGTVKWEQNYLPFGEDLTKPGNEFVDFTARPEYKFTGQRQVEGIGLYYYGARYYDPELGRFITEDTFPGELTDPQTQNIYLYVVNNPLKYVDPTGHYKVAAIDENVLEIIIEENDDLGKISEYLYSSPDMLKYILAMNNYDDLADIQVGDHILLPYVFIIAEENNIQIKQYEPFKIAGMLRSQRKIGERDFRRMRSAYIEEQKELSYTLEDWMADNKDSLLQFMVGVEMQLIGLYFDALTLEAIGFTGLSGGSLAVVTAPAAVMTGTIAIQSHIAGAELMSSALMTMAENGKTGQYKDVKGHHVHAKAAFKEHVNYDPDNGFSISQKYMKSRGWIHSDMTTKQRQLFKELYNSGRPNTLAEHTRIAIEALKAGGATQSEAVQLVQKSLLNLQEQGVYNPTRIPWYTP